MRFGGCQRCSLIDFPGKISAVLFTVGCPFRCAFCHNPSLVLPGQSIEWLTSEEVIDFLQTRVGKLDGVVISGGEPTIHSDLPEFIAAIRAMGFAIKLDTNGSQPEMIDRLLTARLVDYWAMDRKASLARYDIVTAVPIDRDAIVRSTHLLMERAPDYEFRTTVVRQFHPPEEIERIGQELSGARRLVLQQFRPHQTLDPSLHTATAYTPDEMEHLCALARPYVTECYYR